MRIWSLHPRYLDPQGLVALWRETLLAKAVLLGRTRGYTRHPQLHRFQAHTAPALAIDAYLAAVLEEATRRGYTFDRSKVGPAAGVATIPVTTGQLAVEWDHLCRKLAARSPDVHATWRTVAAPECHPLFVAEPGPVAEWEKAPARVA